MLQKYFKDVTTSEDLKSQYRKLCKQFHPDNGGCAADFVAMKEEFRKLWEMFQDVHRKMNGETYRTTKEKRTYKSADEFMDMVDFLTHKLKVTVEINGSFIHVWGIERTDKEKQTKLKEYVSRMPKLKLTFSGQKKCWRIYPADYVKKTGKTWSMDAIRQGFGSTVYKASENEEYKVVVAN